MIKRISFGIALLRVTAAFAAPQTFPLGIDYSERIGSGSLTGLNNVAAATDSQGAIYLLVNGYAGLPGSAQSLSIMKLAPGGSQIVYQKTLAIPASAMAVDPAGNVYLLGSDFVQKLGSDGQTVAYQTVIGQRAISLYAIAVDATGRAYVTGTGIIQATPGAFQRTLPTPPFGVHAFVVRLDPAGAVDYATYLGGSDAEVPSGIAADPSGSAAVTGITYSPDFPVTRGAYLTAANFNGSGLASFLARLSPDGSGLIYSTFTDAQGYLSKNVVVDSAGNAVVGLLNSPGFVVLRLNSSGTAATFSKPLPASTIALAMDAAGNTYISAVSSNIGYPARNSLTSCTAGGSAALTVLDTNGNILQSTYVSGASGDYSGGLGLAVSPDSIVYLAGLQGTTYTPTRQLAGSSGSLLYLTAFSPATNPQTVKLACVGSAASYHGTAIAAGEIVSLFGEELGPATGTQPHVDIQAGFPTQVANVQVTFNGTAGPLFYVQANQINAIAPWSLQTGQPLEICAVYNGVRTNCVTMPVAQAHSGVFTVDGLHAAALNQDGTINSPNNPAKIGTIVSIFATGLGPISPPPSDGAILGLPLPNNLLPVSVNSYTPPLMFGNVPPPPIPIRYGGPAPFEVAGVSQVNFVVPDLTDFPLTLAPGFDNQCCGFALYAVR